MSEVDAMPPRARITDLLRPARLYEGIDAHPRFVLPTLLLVGAVVLYMKFALDVVVPRLVPSLLENAVATESELSRDFRRAFLTGSVLLPMLWVPIAAAVSWGTLRVFRGRSPYPCVASLLAHSGLWVALSFVVKAVLVVLHGNPTAPLNLGAFLVPEATAGRIVLSLTNPFVVLAAVWTIRGLRAWGVHALAATVAGALPWIGVTLVFAGLFRGDALEPTAAPVAMDDWPTIQEGAIILRTAPADSADGASLARAMDGFATRLSEGAGFTARPLRVHVYPDHATLERATGERLHVLVTGSIRGSDLLYLEMPGRSAGVPRERGFRSALRWVGLMELAPVTRSAPRWFIEGIVHATVFPGSQEMQDEYLALLRRTGPPSLERVSRPDVFGTPDGPLLARALVDHIAFSHGPEVLEGLLQDVVSGTDFRDALYARTRWTTSELESGWRESANRMLQDSSPVAGPDPAPAPPDSAADSAQAPAPK